MGTGHTPAARCFVVVASEVGAILRNPSSSCCACELRSRGLTPADAMASGKKKLKPPLSMEDKSKGIRVDEEAATASWGRIRDWEAAAP